MLWRASRILPADIGSPLNIRAPLSGLTTLNDGPIALGASNGGTLKVDQPVTANGLGAVVLAAVFAVAGLVGYRVIREVPPLLHTPLMSGMNALSGVTVLGALAATALAIGTRNQLVGAIAVAIAMVNVVGGFVVTHRMLRMFDNQ